MFKDKLKGLINPEEGNTSNKKEIENLVFFVVILIITIIIINIIWNGDKESNQNKEVQNDTSKQLASTNTSSLEVASSNSNELEIKLEEILSKIQGVGEVNVFINYSESSEIIPMYNENTKTSNTQETDTSGGTRTIEESDSQKEIIYEENDGGLRHGSGVCGTAFGLCKPKRKGNLFCTGFYLKRKTDGFRERK